MALELYQKNYSDGEFTIGDYVVYKELPHVKVRITAIKGKDSIVLIKLDEPCQGTTITIKKEDIYLEKQSPLRYFTIDNCFAHINNLEYLFTPYEFIVSPLGHAHDMIKFNDPSDLTFTKKHTIFVSQAIPIRSTHCKGKDCGTKLNQQINKGVCPDCGWFVCPKCGEHGCDTLITNRKVRKYLCYLKELKSPGYQTSEVFFPFFGHQTADL